jgi:hypothetical protein
MSSTNSSDPASDGIVTVDDLTTARSEIFERGPQDSSRALSEIEPELWGFMTASVHCIAGSLLVAGVDPHLARTTADEALGSLLTCIDALRRAQRRLWDSMDDAPPAPAPNPQATDEAEDLSF